MNGLSGNRHTIFQGWTAILTSLVIVILLFSLTACDSSDNIPVQIVNDHDTLSDSQLHDLQTKASQEKAPDTFYFGFDLRNSPQEDTAQYLPFINYLEQATGYHFKIYFTPKGSTSADELGRNHTQFAAMGASSFLYAQTRYGAIPLVRGLNSQGRAEYQSVFVVRPDSPIHKLQDIKGQRLAFGNRDSTQGHLIPRIVLQKNKIPLSSLASYEYTGSHHNCSEAVISGRADVCAMQDQLAYQLESEGFVKIIYHSAFYPSSGIVANQSVPTQALIKVKQALLNFEPQGKDSAGLYHWELTEMPRGFISSSEDDYRILREWSIHLGFLVDQSPTLKKQRAEETIEKTTQQPRADKQEQAL